MRVDDLTVSRCLDRLDRQIRDPAGLDLRAAERLPYRVGRMTVDLTADDDAVVPYAAVCRNLSGTGIALLVGQFLWPGTACRLTLPSPYGHEETVTGRIVRCRYLVGSSSVHEVGVRFDRPINVALFVPRPESVRILLVDESPGRHELVAGFLEGLDVDLLGVTTALDAAAEALKHEFDVILLDLESPNFDAFLVTKELRGAGYLGPIVGLAVHTGPTLRARCEAAGCTGYLRKPMTRETLRGLVASIVSEPVVSALAHDVALTPLIDQFVGRLRQQARQLSAAFERGESEAVKRIVRTLQGDAGSYGFDPISEEAEHLQVLLELDAPPAQLRGAVYELIHLCRAARPATWETGDPGPDAGSAAASDRTLAI